MSFNLDFEDTFEGGNIEDGHYEVVIYRCNEDSTPSGAEYTEFDLIVRNDVDQKFKNAHIFHKVWKRKDDNKYNMKQFNTIGKACQLENGKTYNSFDDLLKDFFLKTAQVYVKNETNEYNGKTYTNTNVKFWNKTKTNGLNHQFKSQDKEAVGAVAGGFDTSTANVTESNLPF